MHLPATEKPRVYLKDYRAPDFTVTHTSVTMDLDMDRTEIRTRLRVHRAKETPATAPLILDGDGIEPLEVLLNGRRLTPSEYVVSPRALTIPNAPDVFEIETVTTVVPRTNTTVLGLCPTADGDIYSQCEAESFRSFAYSLDRPDVLSTYGVTLRADKLRYPTLLSNGHPTGSGDLPGGRHWASFSDPVPKPTFIFAVLAGRFAVTHERFVTRSGKSIQVGLYAPPDLMDMCRPSLAFVLAAMKWDEDVFGREYDLDVFNVGIMRGFSGAMENKGLNLFDINWIVADPRNTSDDEYEYRMKTTAHEYFHNWSGNKVTIRSWFDVTLKEGLTRFRDQLFLADMTEFTSVRIKMARHMRGNVFAEDDSPVAHPLVWESYLEPRNLFTNTVYDKGQEVIFMLFAMLGRERFCDVVSKFFDRYAGKAVSVEEFLKTFETEAGLDLTQFRLWYYQAGTTSVTVHSHYDAAAKTFAVRLSQHTRPTPGQPHKRPRQIPFAVSLIGPDGKDMSTRLDRESQATPPGTRVLTLTADSQDYQFVDVHTRPRLSRLRYFSAPVRVIEETSDEDLAFFTRHDSDLFARWDSGQAYASRVAMRMVEDYRAGRPLRRDDQFLDAYLSALDDSTLSRRAVADLLILPDERTLGEQMDIIDVDAVHAAHVALKQHVAESGRERLLRAYFDNRGTGIHDLSNHAVGKRRLMNCALDFLMALGDPEMDDLCLKQLESSKNVTEQYRALVSLCGSGSPLRSRGVEVYRERWKHDQLGLDKWYRAQAMAGRADTAEIIDRLMDAPEFDLTMFSRLYTVTEAFCYLNRFAVNEPSGMGYRICTKQLVRADAVVPLIATYMFSRSDLPRWRKFDERRQELIRASIERMLDAKTLSTGLRDLCGKALTA